MQVRIRVDSSCRFTRIDAVVIGSAKCVAPSVIASPSVIYLAAVL